MLCNLCSFREAVFFRKFSGERLCKSCFIHSIEKKVKKTISKYEMFDINDRIAVAVSGGKDSLSLLKILYKIEKKFPKSSLLAVTIDEGISGYRDEAVKNAENFCKKLGVEHHIASFEEIYRVTIDEIAEKIRGKPGELTPCSYCGVLRRKALNKIAKEYKATKLATAHTLDDEVQTIMLNFIHGDFTRAARVEPKLEGGVEGFIQRVKPFCEIPQEEVALYAYFNGIDFQSTECPYASLALRSEIREFLIKLENRHPGTRYNIYRSFEKVRPVLKQSIKYELKSCEICGEPSSKNICESCRMIKKFTS